MYLIDTNVVSEARKGARANPGVTAFFADAAAQAVPLYVSVITIGELRRGVELIRFRGDLAQAGLLETWLVNTVTAFQDRILSFEHDAAQLWGRLRVPGPEHEIDKQIAATAMIYNLTVVTRNVADFAGTGAKVQNPFT